MALVVQHANVQPGLILAVDPSKRATRLRRLSIDISVTDFDITQGDMARALGVSKVIVFLLLKELGDEREQPEIEQALAYVEEAFQS